MFPSLKLSPMLVKPSTSVVPTSKYLIFPDQPFNSYMDLVTVLIQDTSRFASPKLDNIKILSSGIVPQPSTHPAHVVLMFAIDVVSWPYNSWFCLHVAITISIQVTLRAVAMSRILGPGFQVRISEAFFHPVCWCVPHLACSNTHNELIRCPLILTGV